MIYLSFVPGVFNIWMVGVFSLPLLGSGIEIWLRKKHEVSLGWTLAVKDLEKILVDDPDYPEVEKKLKEIKAS